MSIEITDWLRGLGLEQYAPTRDREFADSPLEETVLRNSSLSPNSLVTGKNTGIFIVGASEYD
jgi:hypothetical protein